MNSIEFKELIVRKGISKESSNLFDYIMEVLTKDSAFDNYLDVNIKLATTRFVQSYYDSPVLPEIGTVLNYATEKSFARLYNEIIFIFDDYRELTKFMNETQELFKLFGFTIQLEYHHYLDDYYNLTFLQDED